VGNSGIIILHGSTDCACATRSIPTCIGCSPDDAVPKYHDGYRFCQSSAGCSILQKLLINRADESRKACADEHLKTLTYSILQPVLRGWHAICLRAVPESLRIECRLSISNGPR
jgi:hypothetical protein